MCTHHFLGNPVNFLLNLQDLGLWQCAPLHGTFDLLLTVLPQDLRPNTQIMGSMNDYGDSLWCLRCVKRREVHAYLHAISECRARATYFRSTYAPEEWCRDLNAYCSWASVARYSGTTLKWNGHLTLITSLMLLRSSASICRNTQAATPIKWVNKTMSPWTNNQTIANQEHSQYLQYSQLWLNRVIAQIKLLGIQGCQECSASMPIIMFQPGRCKLLIVLERPKPWYNYCIGLSALPLHRVYPCALQHRNKSTHAYRRRKADIISIEQ